MPGLGDSGDEADVQTLLDALAHIGAAFEDLCNVAVCFKETGTRYAFVFDHSGRHFRGLIPKYEPTEHYPPSHDECTFVADYCNHAPDWVRSLWSARTVADNAIKSLPDTLNGILSQLTGKPWRTDVLHKLIDPVICWPGETLSGYALGSKKVTDHLKTFFERVRENDPCSKWQEYQQLIHAYTNELLSVRSEIVLRPANRESFKRGCRTPADGHKPKKIPPEYRTRPLTKTQAANYLGLANRKRPDRAVDHRMRNGTLQFEYIPNESRRYIFNKSDFSPSVWLKISE